MSKFNLPFLSLNILYPQLSMEKLNFIRTISHGSTAIVEEYTFQGNKFAIKKFSLETQNDKKIKKEMIIHKNLKHKNIVRFIDFRSTFSESIIVMEFVHSELFLLLESKKGFHKKLVHFFFTQLISALKYLHDKNICHRDIKPENILLSETGDLKLADFGSATVFKYKKNDRRLTTLVGTLPFISPEVHMRSYNGPGSDIWSAGILLFVMATGYLPWKKGTSDDQEFTDFFKMSYHDYLPFSKCPSDIFGLFRSICVNEKKRLTLVNILDSDFMRQENDLLGKDLQCVDAKMLFSYFSNLTETIVPFSLPNYGCFSPYSQKFACSLPNNDRLNLKRAYIPTEEEKLMSQIIAVLKSFNVNFERKMFALLFSTVDTYRNILKGEFTIKRMNEVCVVSINRLRGSSLEFTEFCNLVLSHIKK